MTRFISTLDRRTMIIGGLSGAASLLTPHASAMGQNPSAQLDINTPQGNLDAFAKLLGSTERETTYTSFKGILWGIAPNQAPLQLCGFHGLGRFDWVPKSDGSYLKRSFDVGMFSDLKTGEPLEDLRNPYTSEMVQPHHFTYGGGQELLTAKGTINPDAEPAQKPKPLDLNWDRQGDTMWLNSVGSGTFPHPLPYKEWPVEAGTGKYHYSAEYTYVVPAAQLLDPAQERAYYKLFWSSITSWEVWLLMGDAPGFVHWRGYGQKLARPEDAHPPLLRFIEQTQPNYFDDAPPWDATRSSFRSFRETRTPAPLKG